ncbi:WG repeat-containing protein [Microscilla marina]|uniref:KWG n=1 Tax=Microscilla marina ATCC 23134 TaxID=313606 RepID=A1ZY00_MICM2|nr:WG repeat-containing protein [Microscilla marina]EAY24737.1 KWG [Microscilla marina ATCC 23134]
MKNKHPYLACFILLLSILHLSVSAQKLPKLIPYRKGDQWGFCNKNKKVIIPCVYTSASPFAEGLARVSNKERNFGFINSKGKVVIPFVYDWVHNVHDGWIYAEIQSPKWGNVGGFIDKQGKIVVPFRLETPPVPLPESERYFFSEGLMAIPWKVEPFNNTKYGYINKSGKFVIQPSLGYATQFKNGLAATELKNYSTHAYINKKGKVVFKDNYYTASAFVEGRARVRKNDLMGFINTSGKVIIPIKYYTFQDFSEGLVSISNGKKTGFMDKKGQVVIPFTYEAAYSFNNGLALVVKNKKVGFINRKGQVVIPLQYDFNREFYNITHVPGFTGFHNNYCVVWKQNKMGFINRKGQTVIDFKYDGFGAVIFPYHHYSQGLALVKQGEKQFYIDMQGNEYYED